MKLQCFLMSCTSGHQVRRSGTYTSNQEIKSRQDVCTDLVVTQNSTPHTLFVSTSENTERYSLRQPEVRSGMSMVLHKFQMQGSIMAGSTFSDTEMNYTLRDRVEAMLM
jgi:hypothetical protein